MLNQETTLSIFRNELARRRELLAAKWKPHALRHGSEIVDEQQIIDALPQCDENSKRSQITAIAGWLYIRPHG